MSRNSDKANTVLFRYQEQKAEASGYIDYNSTQRPRSVQKVTILKDAENWRKQVLKEISQKVTKIHDEKLSNYQIRDLNDEINKLMRERYAWEYRIKELGGSDYTKTSSSKFNEGGVLIRGYRYFGRAKELPGVKEILAKQLEDNLENENKFTKAQTQREKLKLLEERINLDYYGYSDELRDDQDLRKEVWEQVNDILGEDLSIEDEQGKGKPKDELLKYERGVSRKLIKKLSNEPKATDDKVLIIDDGPIPSLKEVESYLVMKRREQLADKYNI